MNMTKQIGRHFLDCLQLKKIFSLNIEQPSGGWIKTIRKALGMSTTQLAKRLGVKQPRILVMEKNERNLKLSTLERIAEALDCNLVFALAPKDTLANTVNNRAKEKAKKMLEKINYNMALEDQNSENNQKYLEQLAITLIDSKHLWDKDD